MEWDKRCTRLGPLLVAAVLGVGCSEHVTGEAELAPTISPCSRLETLPFDFASKGEARDILATPDAWAEQLSAFDRGARMRTLDPTDTPSFLSFVSENALPWELNEISYWSRLATDLIETLQTMDLQLPSARLIKTTGLEEFNAAYTRNNAIILPQERLSISGNERRDFFLLAHEYFHSVSYADEKLRRRLYEALGFEPLDAFAYPSELEHRRVSNPQAHHYTHALEVTVAGGSTAHVVPVIQATVPLEDMLQLPTSGPPPIFGVIEILLIAVDLPTGDVRRNEDGEAIIYTFNETDWPARMQRNSGYIIHPEELLADNFALLMEWRRTGEQPRSTPSGFATNDIELLLMIEETLTSYAVSVENQPRCYQALQPRQDHLLR